MKKLICLLLVLCALFPFYSCGSWDLDDLPEVTGDDLTEETPDVIDSNAPYALSSKNPIQKPETFASAPGMIIFKFQRKPMYYNTVTGKCYLFCFNPGCKHRYNECLNNKLQVTNHWTYSNGKFYVAYIDSVLGANNMSGIATVSMDASHMEVLYRCDTMHVHKIDAAGDYIYLWGRSGSEYVLTVYNLKTGEAEIKKGNDNGRKFGSRFLVTEDKLIYYYNDDPYVYCSDLDFTNEKELCDKLGAFIYSDNKLYYLKESDTRNTTGGHEWNLEVYEYDMATGNDRYVTTVTNGMSNFFCVADGYLYYSPIGKYAVGSSQRAEDNVTVSGGEICRIDLSTGEVKNVFFNKYLDFKDVFSINGKLYAVVQYHSSNSWLGSKGYGKRLYGELIDTDGDDDLEFKFFEWDETEIAGYFDIAY